MLCAPLKCITANVCICARILLSVCLFLTARPVDLNRLVAFQRVRALLTHALFPTEGHSVPDWERTSESGQKHKPSNK